MLFDSTDSIFAKILQRHYDLLVSLRQLELKFNAYLRYLNGLNKIIIFWYFGWFEWKYWGIFWWIFWWVIRRVFWRKLKKNLENATSSDCVHEMLASIFRISFRTYQYIWFKPVGHDLSSKTTFFSKIKVFPNSKFLVQSMSDYNNSKHTCWYLLTPQKILMSASGTGCISFKNLMKISIAEVFSAPNSLSPKETS